MAKKMDVNVKQKKQEDFLDNSHSYQHQHSKNKIIKRYSLSRKQYVNFLATPKGYRYERKKAGKSSSAESSEMAMHSHGRGESCNCKSKGKTSGAKYYHSLKPCNKNRPYVNNLLDDLWANLTPDTVDKLKEMLMKEFNMTNREAEEFFLDQRLFTPMTGRYRKNRTPSCFPCFPFPPEKSTEKQADIFPNSFTFSVPCPDLCCSSPQLSSFFDNSVVKCSSKKKRKVKGKRKNKNALALQNSLINDTTKILASKLSDFAQMMLTTKRTKRIKNISEKILNNLCKITGEECTLTSPQTTAQKILVFIADRLAVWLATIPCACDKRLKEICKKVKEVEKEDELLEEEEEEVDEGKEEIEDKKKKKKEPVKKVEKDKEKKSEEEEKEAEKEEEKSAEKKEEKSAEKKEEKAAEKKEEKAAEKEEEKAAEKEEEKSAEKEEEKAAEKEEEKAAEKEEEKSAQKEEEKVAEKKEEKVAEKKEDKTEEKKVEKTGEEEKPEKEEPPPVDEPSKPEEEEPSKTEEEEKEKEESKPPKEEESRPPKEEEEEHSHPTEEREPISEEKEEEKEVEEEQVEKGDEEQVEKGDEEQVEKGDEEQKEEEEEDEVEEEEEEEVWIVPEEEVEDEIEEEVVWIVPEEEEEEQVEEEGEDEVEKKGEDKVEKVKVEIIKEESKISKHVPAKKAKEPKKISIVVKSPAEKGKKAFHVKGGIAEEIYCDYKITPVGPDIVCQKVKEGRQTNKRPYTFDRTLIPPSKTPFKEEDMRNFADFTSELLTGFEFWRDWIGETCLEAEANAKKLKEQLLQREELLKWKVEKQRQALRWKLFKVSMREAADIWKDKRQPPSAAKPAAPKSSSSAKSKQQKDKRK